MKYNYPVKYMEMPIIEQVGWSPGLHGLERKYEVVCYIVSKCFLISDRTKYKENGKQEKEYEVVFPYQKNTFDNCWERVTPSFNNFKRCINRVAKVFDSYNEALEYVKKKNEELCDLYISSEKIQEFNDRLSRYKLLEQQILDNTSNLDQSHIKVLDELIISSGDKLKIYHGNLYEYLNYITNSRFIVYSLSSNQYNKLLELLNNQDLSSISTIIKNATPILYYDYKINDENIMVIDKNGNVLYYINDWKTLISNDKQELPAIKLNSLDNNIECCFTTETLEDILLSYNQYQNKYINPYKIQGPVLKRISASR